MVILTITVSNFSNNVPYESIEYAMISAFFLIDNDFNGYPYE